MSGGWSTPVLVLLLAGAGLLLLLDLVLSVALTASFALSRVALHRLGADSGYRLAFLAEIQDPTSPHRMAAAILRQLSLLGAILLLVLAGRGAGLALPAITGVGVGALVGVVVIESVLARSIALWNPRRVLRVSGLAMHVAHALLYPLVRGLRVLLDRVSSGQARTDEQRDEQQDADVEALIQVGESEGLLEAEEGEMMRGIVDLDETLVREIMTPRPQIVALPVETRVAEARRVVLESTHSRLPVYRDSIDNVVGILHARDLFRAWEEGGDEQTLAGYLRAATFVAETLSAAELLAEMRERTHVAVVVDEYGGVAGLVTIEDLLEEIVGDIREEHEAELELVHREDDGSFVINAVAHVDELETLFGLGFDERDFDTVGGMVVASFGRVPTRGERKQIHGLDVEVLQADRRRVQWVRVRPPAGDEAAQSGPA